MDTCDPRVALPEEPRTEVGVQDKPNVDDGIIDTTMGLSSEAT